MEANTQHSLLKLTRLLTSPNVTVSPLKPFKPASTGQKSRRSHCDRRRDGNVESLPDVRTAIRLHILLGRSCNRGSGRTRRLHAVLAAEHFCAGQGRAPDSQVAHSSCIGDHSETPLAVASITPTTSTPTRPTAAWYERMRILQHVSAWREISRRQQRLRRRRPLRLGRICTPQRSSVIRSSRSRRGNPDLAGRTCPHTTSHRTTPRGRESTDRWFRCDSL